MRSFGRRGDSGVLVLLVFAMLLSVVPCSAYAGAPPDTNLDSTSFERKEPAVVGLRLDTGGTESAGTPITSPRDTCEIACRCSSDKFEPVTTEIFSKLMNLALLFPGLMLAFIGILVAGDSEEVHRILRYREGLISPTGLDIIEFMVLVGVINIFLEVISMAGLVLVDGFPPGIHVAVVYTGVFSFLLISIIMLWTVKDLFGRPPPVGGGSAGGHMGPNMPPSTVPGSGTKPATDGSHDADRVDDSES